MTNERTARKILAAFLLIFAATMATLFSRQFSLGPARPSPAFRTLGPADAQIEIYEYTDFACPACRVAEEHVKNILAFYKGSVRVNFKHYPLLTIHPWSQTAAAYADCAGRQGKFHEYAGMLFEEQGKWAQAKELPAEFSRYAGQLNLDVPEIEKCAADPATIRQILLDTSEGDIRGVNATPTFFINGKRAVGGAQLLEQTKHFDNLLKKKP